MLIARAANADLTWHKDFSSAPRVSPEFDLTLDDKAVLRTVEQLNFIQMKRKCPAKALLLSIHSLFLTLWNAALASFAREQQKILHGSSITAIVLVSFAAYCACLWPGRTRKLALYGLKACFRSLKFPSLTQALTPSLFIADKRIFCYKML